MTTKAIDQLLKEKQKFEALFNFASIGIVIADSKGSISLVNQHAENLLGYKSEELIGNKVEILLPASQHHSHTTNRQQYTVHPEVRPMGHGRDLEARKKDGSLVPVEISLSYFHTEDGLFVIAFIMDITLRKKSEAILHQQKADLISITEEVKQLNSNLEAEVERRTEALRQTLNELEASRMDLQDALDREKQLGELKSRFVTMASHEFKTPLATILTSATLIGKYQKESDQVQREKHLKRINDTVLNLSNLLNEFLSIGKLEEGKIQVKTELFHLPELIREVVGEMQNQAGDGIKIRFESENVSKVELDKELIRNILFNLLSNAIKFSPPSSTILVKTNREENQLEISVSDQGIGISEEDQKHLFERFFRGRNADNIQGTGLGLHIVQRYLALLGGSIKVESQLNRGTTITLLFENK